MTQRDWNAYDHANVTGRHNVFDAPLIIASILLALTVGTAIEYYRLIRHARKEYEKAKDIVEDVVFSFNRDLKREAEQLELLAYKTGAIASKSEAASSKAGDVEKQFQTLSPHISLALADRDRIVAALEANEKKLCDVASSQGAVMSRLTSIEEKAKQLAAVSEANVDAVIPIKRDKALAPLTETELETLEFLASEGTKTAPDIKWRIRLSREHTARLMKKLYESGYLERDTNKIPFKYSITKEMENLLKKTQSEAT